MCADTLGALSGVSEAPRSASSLARFLGGPRSHPRALMTPEDKRESVYLIQLGRRTWFTLTGSEQETTMSTLWPVIRAPGCSVWPEAKDSCRLAVGGGITEEQGCPLRFKVKEATLPSACVRGGAEAYM